MKGLDLRGFKKTHDDAKKAILKHDDGHEIHIAKSGLSQSLHKQLDKIPLAEGGKVEKSASPQAPKPQEPKKPDTSQTQEPVTAEGIQKGFTNAMGFSNGGYAAEDSEDGTPLPEESNAAAKGMEASGAIPDFTNREAIPVNPTPVQGGLLQNSLGTEPGVQNPGDQPAGLTPEQHQALDQAMMSGQNPEDALKGVLGYSQNADAIKAEGDIQSKGLKAQANIAGQAASAANKNLQDFQTHVQGMDSEIENFVQDAKDGHINPNQYLESMDTGQKVSTAIGLILGGIGGGLTGQENPAMKFLNSQIERNIQGQRADMANKHNVLSALERHYGNKTVAENMLRVMTAAKWADDMQQASLKTQSQLAPQIAKQKSAELVSRYAPLLRDNALIMMGQGAAQGQAGQPGQEGLNQTAPEQLVSRRSDIPDATKKEIYSEIDRAKLATERGPQIMELMKQAHEDLNPSTTHNPLYLTGAVTPPSIKEARLLLDPVLHETDGRINPQIQQHADAILGKILDNKSTLEGNLDAMSQFLNERAKGTTSSANFLNLKNFASTRGVVHQGTSPQQRTTQGQTSGGKPMKRVEIK